MENEYQQTEINAHQSNLWDESFHIGPFALPGEFTKLDLPWKEGYIPAVHHSTLRNAVIFAGADAEGIQDAHSTHDNGSPVE